MKLPANLELGPDACSMVDSAFFNDEGNPPMSWLLAVFFSGQLFEFGEPTFGCVIPATKATAKWNKNVVSGKG